MAAVKSFMTELDEWTEEHVIRPLYTVAEAYVTSGKDDIKAEESMWHTDGLIKKAIREKVLESYHNGQNARPRGSQRPLRR